MSAGRWRILKSIVILKLFPWYARHGVKFDIKELSTILEILYKEGTPHDLEDATKNVEHPIRPTRPTREPSQDAYNSQSSRNSFLVELLNSISRIGAKIRRAMMTLMPKKGIENS